MVQKIKRSVGKRGKNDPADVTVVQGLLKKLGYKLGKTGPKKDGVDGDYGRNTEAAILGYQKKIGIHKPTGLIEPGDDTWKALSAGLKTAKQPPADKKTGAKKATGKPEEKKEEETKGGKAASSLKLSNKGTKWLKDIEKLRLKPYDDQSGKEITAWVKGATIGYGHLIAKSDWKTYKDGITEKEASTLFDKDLAPYVKVVKSKVTAKVTQNQFDAMVILAFNIGESGFKSSSVLKLVNDPKAKTSYKDLESAWKAWNKSQGKVMKGLKNRRNAEWDIYSKGVYNKW